MPRKVIMLAGAPEGHALNWTTSILLNHFLDPIARFAHLEAPLEAQSQDPSFLAAPGPALWRSIPRRREQLPTGFSQIHALAQPYQGSTEFFNTHSVSLTQDTSLTADESGHDICEQFYDHSLAIQEDISSSQLPSTTSFMTDESSVEITRGDHTNVSESNDDYTEIPDGTCSVGAGHLSDLEDLPNAKYLQSIQPQTMTVNIIVGVISVTKPRTVRTRWGTTMALVELLVGDETRSGFTITFWLSTGPTDANVLLQNLRRQDILLLRNVALSVFKDKVHGHSLRKGHTKIHLLHRKRLDRDDQGGQYSMKEMASKRGTHPQLVKTRKVWDWLLHFVEDGGTSLPKKRHGVPVRRWDLPPKDTQ
ncbi:hypothetical protein GGS20DRAFT_549344 [Poronia punctata]|nr:hypothetical protein GGS20DRAFT_549344 [Poronia punctata]